MKYLTLGLLIALTSGCVSYDTHGRFGGYYHNRVEENLYTVTYKGNILTPFDKAYELTIQRAKEIGKELGYTHMYVLGVGENSETEDVGIRKGIYFIDTFGLKEPKYSIKVKYLFNNPKDKYLNSDVYEL